jgi:hypothetical protein
MYYLHTCCKIPRFPIGEGAKNLHVMCLATTFSLFLLCDGDGINLPVTKVVNFDGSNLKITITSCNDNNMWRCHNDSLQCRHQ